MLYRRNMGPIGNTINTKYVFGIQRALQSLHIKLHYECFKAIAKKKKNVFPCMSYILCNTGFGINFFFFLS